jgi:hypothetical protein
MSFSTGFINHPRVTPDVVVHNLTVARHYTPTNSLYDFSHREQDYFGAYDCFIPFSLGSTSSQTRLAPPVSLRRSPRTSRSAAKRSIVIRKFAYGSCTPPWPPHGDLCGPAGSACEKPRSRLFPGMAGPHRTQRVAAPTYCDVTYFDSMFYEAPGEAPLWRNADIPAGSGSR